MNLLCGVVGVIFAFHGRQEAALVAMLAAAVFDFCDGLAARALGAYSDIGKELDSLCDVVSFGVLPTVMMFCTAGALGISGIWPYFTLPLCVFSALRLAKFNVDERQHDSFIGLATPPSAMICAALCAWAASDPTGPVASICAAPWVLPALACCLSLLLVSEIPMFAFKFGKGKEADARTRTLRWIFLAATAVCVALVVLLSWHWSAVILLTFASYVIINLIAAAI